jgi:hypothetical protein
MYPAAMLNGEPKEGYSSWSLIEAVKAIAAEKLKVTVKTGWFREQATRGNEAIYIFHHLFVVHILLQLRNMKAFCYHYL